ncbi:MAG: hypothetical protein AAGG48_19270 [Planctomycetota bacterium]
MSSAPIPWKHIRQTLILFAPLWGGAVILFGVMGVGYALFRTKSFSARQPLVVRDEANRSFARLGRFPSQTELKAAQETILEMTQNREVVAAALRQIGPPDGVFDPTWPSTEWIDTVANRRVNLLASQGTEFGNTEVVYLQVEAVNKERASMFCDAMFDNLKQQLRNVRRVRADSVIEELTHNRNLASQDLDEATDRLHQIEVKFATDLSELRNLSDSISSDGTNRRTLEQTTRDLQVAELELEKMHALLALLLAGSEDPQRLLVSGGDLLASQPSLQRMKDGLIDAQLRSSELAGTVTSDHPKLRAAAAAEKEIKQRMQQETAAVILAMQPTLKLEQERVERLRARQEELKQRLNHLALARTEYAKLDAEVRHRTEALAEAERLLTEAKASRSAAISTNLIAALGPPQVSDHPVGPSGSTLTFGSVSAGLIFGLGCVFLIAPGPTSSQAGRRWSDFLGAGRRRSDQPGGSDADPDRGNAERGNPSDRRSGPR